MRQVDFRTYGCTGCSPLIVGAILIAVGLSLQTSWAGDVAAFLVRAFGFLMVGLGAVAIVLSVVRWLMGRRRPPWV